MATETLSGELVHSNDRIPPEKDFQGVSQGATDE